MGGNVMNIWILLIPVVIIVASYFEIYRLKHITVAYKDEFGSVRGYAFYYAYPLKESWMNISEFEKYVAAKRKLSEVKIEQIKIRTKWKLRRAQDDERENNKLLQDYQKNAVYDKKQIIKQESC